MKKPTAEEQVRAWMKTATAEELRLFVRVAFSVYGPTTQALEVVATVQEEANYEG